MSFLVRALLLVSLLLSSSLKTAQATEVVTADHIRVSVLAPKVFSNSQPTNIGFYFEPTPGWHIYWKNPGDSGTAPKFEFTSTGFKNIGPTQWPYPHRIPFGPLTNLGYEGPVALLFQATPDGKTETQIEAKLEWLVCKEECVPGFATVSLKRPAQKVADWSEQTLTLLKFFEAKVPQDSSSAPAKIRQVRFDPKTAQLRVTVDTEAKEFELYPVGGDFIQASRPEMQANELIFKTMPGAKAPDKTAFVFSFTDKAWEFKDIPVAGAELHTGSASFGALALLLLSAFLGGLILNLMPCVFPVLSIKIFSLLKTGERHARDGVFYTLGVLATFTALGGVFLLLRQAGQSVGWGFQLQSPVIVLCLAALFWMMALNFLGAFEFGNRLMSFAGNQKSNSSFATGVLAVFIAAPCTGPFMGTALGAAIALPTYQAMSIFIGLGLGLAFPFLLISISPALARSLPKPGAWMETVKQLFAFPLFATVIWLLWVLGLQTGSQGWVTASSLFLILSFCVWISKSRGQTVRVVSTLVALAALGGAISQVHSAETPETARSEVWKPFDQSVVDQALAENKAVFIDFTAAWCITCQVNKKVVLETAAIQKQFADHNVVLIRADWTKYDPKITDALAKFGRSSVPVYVFYSAGSSTPQILPQILSSSTIANLFSTSEVEK